MVSISLWNGIIDCLNIYRSYYDIEIIYECLFANSFGQYLSNFCLI